MEEVNTEWLPHLADEIISETQGTLLDAYVVALEGWRRGLTLRWHVKDSEKFKEMKTWYVDQPGQLFSLSSNEKTHYFFRTRGDKVINEAVELGMDKAKTKQILKEKGISVPDGKHFTGNIDNEDILQYANTLGYPLVIKPIDGSFGKGVVANITSEGELMHSLDYVRQELGYQDIIVEQYIPGDDLRLYVVEDKVVGAIKRIPPNIIGDGINSIEALIALKNEERSLSPRLVSCQIKVDKEILSYIGRSGYDLNTVPEKGEQVFLSDKANISYGGDPIDVLDELSSGIKDTAVKALQSIPGLVHGAVDMLLQKDAETGEEKGYVIELNPTSQLGGILYPIHGKARDVPRAIIDYYFPETKEKERLNDDIYFDFYDVLEPLQSRQAHVSTVTPSPQGKIYAKKYTVSGDVQDIGYHRGLRKQAFERFLHGFVMNKENGDIDVIVGGLDPEMVDDFKNAFWEDEERAHVVDVQETDYDEPLKVGFEVKADIKTLKEELDLLNREIERTNFEMKKAEVERRKLYNSLSWKTTKPIRIFGAIFKNK
ncbi:ATP-grasp domain-containing protein [Cerasibacillus terrae]|uniref:Acylphosphatase n=1 Tax=Cerasibacillus terrae TaxID=2498845 RepID=A0A5C8NZE9_9BACI|nr:acylphosphatase [Cerasibacillus terrae]TXL66679.1 ATP-grasp domain-containing protein [Cerasibacillus terrae]